MNIEKLLERILGPPRFKKKAYFPSLKEYIITHYGPDPPVWGLPPVDQLERPQVVKSQPLIEMPKVTVDQPMIQRVYEALNTLAALIPYREQDGPLDVINTGERLGLTTHTEAQTLRSDWNHVRCYEEGIPLPGTPL
jgi:hypothetical protein